MQLLSENVLKDLFLIQEARVGLAEPPYRPDACLPHYPHRCQEGARREVQVRCCLVTDIHYIGAMGAKPAT